MKTVKCCSLIIALVLITFISVVTVCPDIAEAARKEEPALSTDDCVKCHAAPPADIKAAGGRHQGVGCTGCHIGHPPTVKKPIPLCSQCHAGKSHFDLPGCLNCHKNPHTPLNISFDANITDACLTCHTRQIAQLRDNKSKHTSLNCSSCHSVHRQFPQCTKCHNPHSDEMTAADCRKCHKAHMPKVVTYAADVPSKDCGACHKAAFSLLAGSGTKHGGFACAFCHQEKHKTVPDCRDCHGSPHPEGIMAKFAKCGECHNIAHDLNNWTMRKKALGEAPKIKR